MMGEERTDSYSAGRRFDPYTAHQSFQPLPNHHLAYVKLVPSHGTNFFNLRIQLVHKPLFPAWEPLRVMI